MPLLTKSQKRTTISALRSSGVRAVEQNYNEPARLWCNEEWVTAACLRCTAPRCMKFIDAEIRPCLKNKSCTINQAMRS